MTLALAIGVVVVFATTLDVLNLPAYAREVGRRNQACVEVLRSDSMDDEAKEKSLQKHARRLFVLLGILGGGSILALALPLAGVWGLEQMGVGSLSAVLALLQRLDFLVGTIVAGGLGYLLIRSLRRS